MKNKAKCKLCGDMIESWFKGDLRPCKCGEIAVDGGDAMYAMARDWRNFLRVDDEGNEIEVKVEGEVKPIELEERKPMTKEEMLENLESIIRSYDNMPENALYGPVTHYDMQVALMLILEIFKKI